jgi:4-amino-4-deoxychorismate lyase
MSINEIDTPKSNEDYFFETIKCDDYEIFNLSYHKKRISNTIGMNLNLEEYLYPPSNKLFKCKLVYSKDEIISIDYTPYTPKTIKNFKLIFDDEIEYKYKSTNRSKIDQLYGLRDNCDEIIIVKNGLITDTSIANIAIYLSGQWYTPKLPLLYGTTRNRYLENGILKEKDINVKILKKATKIAILNAMVDFKNIEEFSFN